MDDRYEYSAVSDAIQVLVPKGGDVGDGMLGTATTEVGTETETEMATETETATE